MHAQIAASVVNPQLCGVLSVAASLMYKDGETAEPPRLMCMLTSIPGHRPAAMTVSRCGFWASRCSFSTHVHQTRSLGTASSQHRSADLWPSVLFGGTGCACSGTQACRSTDRPVRAKLCKALIPAARPLIYRCCRICIATASPQTMRWTTSARRRQALRVCRMYMFLCDRS